MAPRTRRKFESTKALASSTADIAANSGSNEPTAEKLLQEKENVGPKLLEARQYYKAKTCKPTSNSVPNVCTSTNEFRISTNLEIDADDTPTHVSAITTSTSKYNFIALDDQESLNRMHMSFDEYIMPKIFKGYKFVVDMSELEFSNDDQSIAQFVCNHMNIPECQREKYWGIVKDKVRAGIKKRRNNVGGYLKDIFYGKSTRRLFLFLYQLCHTYFCHKGALHKDINELGDTGRKEFLHPDFFNKHRFEQYTVFRDFVDFYAPAILGSIEYDKVKIQKPVSEWLSCTDEALILIMLENSWDRYATQQCMYFLLRYSIVFYIIGGWIC